jgi:hypothetical protein
MYHATNSSLIKRNGAVCNVTDAQIIGQDYLWDEPTEIHLVSKYPIENKIASLIRQKLCISGNRFDQLCNDGKIVSLSGQNLKKGKMKYSVIFQISP